MKKTYYVSIQSYFPKTSIQKCGFSSCYYDRVHWDRLEEIEGDINIAILIAKKTARYIAVDEQGYLVYTDSNGIYRLISEKPEIKYANRYNEVEYAW